MDAKEKINQRMEESTKEIDKYTSNPGRIIAKLELTPTHPANQSNTIVNATPTHNGAKTYAQTLISPPPHANPKIAAREGIRAKDCHGYGNTCG